jgi:hypothetical protein
MPVICRSACRHISPIAKATKANAHVKLPDGSTLKVTTERDVLRDDTVNRLYKLAMLRIKAEYNVLTRELRSNLSNTHRQWMRMRFRD